MGRLPTCPTAAPAPRRGGAAGVLAAAAHEAAAVALVREGADAALDLSEARDEDEDRARRLPAARRRVHLALGKARHTQCSLTLRDHWMRGRGHLRA